MGLNLNTALYNANGIDLNSVNKVASEILKSAQAKQDVQVQNIDYSKFNRASLGVDLYSNRTNAQLQKQIALTQAGLYAQSINVAKLNSAAAANLYSAQNVQKNVELTQSFAASELTPVTKIQQIENNIKLFQTSDKNPNSKNGNPFTSKSSDKE